MKRLTNKEFIKRAKEKHGDKYDYSKTEYITSRNKVVITCPIHGDFEMFPHKHLAGQNCKKCSNISRKKKKSLSTASFIKQARNLYGDLYDYSLVDCINQSTKVKIICPTHGEFLQTPKNHRKSGCYKCAREKNSGWTTQDWIKKS